MSSTAVSVNSFSSATLSDDFSFLRAAWSFFRHLASAVIVVTHTPAESSRSPLIIGRGRSMSSRPTDVVSHGRNHAASRVSTTLRLPSAVYFSSWYLDRHAD